MMRIVFVAILFLLCDPQIDTFAEGRFDLSGPKSGAISCNQQAIPLHFSDGHKIAVLSLLSPSPDAWRAEIQTTKQTLILDPRAPGPGFLDWRTIMFDVPSDSKVNLRCPEGNPMFRFIGYIDEFNKQEALFDRDWPKPLKAKEVAPYKTKADALGTLRNVDAKSRTWSDCNAVRVAKGYWLTNLHCFASKAAYESLVADQFGFVILNGMDPSGPISMTTRPVARGRIVLSWLMGGPSAMRNHMFTGRKINLARQPTLAIMLYLRNGATDPTDQFSHCNLRLQ